MYLLPLQLVLSSVALHVHCSQRHSACVFIRITIGQVILTKGLLSYPLIQVSVNQSINIYLLINLKKHKSNYRSTTLNYKLKYYRLRNMFMAVNAKCCWKSYTNYHYIYIYIVWMKCYWSSSCRFVVTASQALYKPIDMRWLMYVICYATEDPKMEQNHRWIKIKYRPKYTNL